LTDRDDGPEPPQVPGDDVLEPLPVRTCEAVQPGAARHASRPDRHRVVPERTQVEDGASLVEPCQLMEPEYRPRPGVAEQELARGEEVDADGGGGERVAPSGTHAHRTRGPEPAQADAGQHGRHEDEEQDPYGKLLLVLEEPRRLARVPSGSSVAARHDGQTDQPGKREKPDHDVGRNERGEQHEAGQPQRKRPDEADPGVTLVPAGGGTDVDPDHARRRFWRLRRSPRPTATRAAHQEPLHELPQEVIADDPDSQAGCGGQAEPDGLTARIHLSPSRSLLPARP